MKFPKLKNVGWCVVVYVLVLMIPFFLATLVPVIVFGLSEINGRAISGVTALVMFFVPMLCALIFYFKIASLDQVICFVFKEIVVWKRENRKNGRKKAADCKPFESEIYPEISLDMSLWELIRFISKENRETEKQLADEGARMMENLRDGEAHIGGESIFCRVGDRMAAVLYQEVAEGEFKGLNAVFIPYRWLLPKKQKISKSDRENLRRIIGDKLRSEGIDFFFYGEEQGK